MYNYVCYKCGAKLDPGEKCDCELISNRLEAKYTQLLEVNEDGQYTIQGIMQIRILKRE